MMDEEEVAAGLDAGDGLQDEVEGDLGDGGYCDPTMCYTPGTGGGGWGIKPR